MSDRFQSVLIHEPRPSLAEQIYYAHLRANVIPLPVLVFHPSKPAYEVAAEWAGSPEAASCQAALKEVLNAPLTPGLKSLQ